MVVGQICLAYFSMALELRIVFIFLKIWGGGGGKEYTTETIMWLTVPEILSIILLLTEMFAASSLGPFSRKREGRHKPSGS